MLNQKKSYSINAPEEHLAEPSAWLEDANNLELQRYLSKWNWSAFFFWPLWLFLTRQYALLLCYFVPVLNIAIAFKCLFEGNRMAWESGRWVNVEDLKKAQSKCRTTGIALYLVLFLMGAMLSYSRQKQAMLPIYESVLQELSLNEEVIDELGSTLRFEKQLAWPERKGPYLMLPVWGDLSNGDVFLQLSEREGRTQIWELLVRPVGEEEAIAVVENANRVIH